MSPVQSIRTVAVYVTEVERSKRFYGDLLGLAQLESHDRVAYQIGDSRLLLHPTDPGEGARHSRLELHLGVDDLDGFVARLAERATPVLQEPVDQPWGEREAIVLDPDGYPVFLVHQAAANQEQPEPREQAATAGISGSAGRRASAALQVNAGGEVQVAFDSSAPPGQIRGSHGVWSIADHGYVTINGADEAIELQVNPDLELDLQINAAGARIRDVSGRLNAHLNVGEVVVNGRFDHGESRLYCNAGDINVTLEPGSDVRLRVSPHVRWQVDTDLTTTGLGEWVMGEGTALLDIHGSFGSVTVKQA
jgi:catechol 2,3-dioxygenase-like lactoylglutathione lyase family enzyme